MAGKRKGSSKTGLALLVAGGLGALWFMNQKKSEAAPPVAFDPYTGQNPYQDAGGGPSASFYGGGAGASGGKR
jgi:hypothetical protein